jgi:hypothetical protein
MKVYYVGNFKPSHSTETHIAATLEDLGHQVQRQQEDQLTPGELLRAVSVDKPDIVLWTRTWPGYVVQRDLESLKGFGTPTVSYHLDLYVGINRQAGLDDDPFWRTDFVFTPDGDPRSAEVFKAKGINHHYLKPGVFKPECVKGVGRDDYRYNVAFIGKTVGYHEEWPYRQKLIEFLKAAYGGWFRIYGSPYKSVRGQELNDVLASTKVIIGDTLCPNFTHEGYWSDRVYETTGRGGFIIHPRIKGLETEFTEHEEIAFYNYGDFDHLKELIDWYIKHDDYREAVRDKGMNRTINEHTYHNRVKELLEAVNAN